MISSTLKQFALCLRSQIKVVVIYSWLSVVGLFIASKSLPSLILLIKVFLSMTGMAFGMYFFNDICDFEQDTTITTRAFTPSSRPLASGLVSKRRMAVFSALMVAFGLTASAMINLDVLLIQLAFFVLFYVYSAKPMRLKRIFLMKQVTTVIGGAIACLTPGLAVGSISIQLLYLTGLYVLFTAGVNPLGDIRDIDSDRVGGVKTIPIVWGPKFTIRLALATFTAASFSTWVAFMGLGFNIALPVLGTIVFAAFAYVVYPLIGRLEDYEYVVKALYTRCLPLYFVLQLAVLIGSF